MNLCFSSTISTLIFFFYCCIGLFQDVTCFSSPLTTSSKPAISTTHRTSFLLKIDEDKKENIGDRTHLLFDYDFNELVLRDKSLLSSSSSSSSREEKHSPNQGEKTTIVLLIQPIGVGIGRWYYNRLLKEMSSSIQNLEGTDDHRNLIFLAPDLLGCGSACNPSQVMVDETNDDRSDQKKSYRDGSIPLEKLPLLQVKDWADQLCDLMIKYESKIRMKNKDKNTEENQDEYNWCIVSNGGCVPIALEVGKRYVKDKTKISPITNLILSATPSVESLFSVQDMNKIQKSYNTLSGIAGSLFWWYALRNNGTFIQKFSEKNLAARAENLGEDWTPNCVETAKGFEGRSRFSTFAFLAGSLNGNNNERLKALEGKDTMNIDVITGGDTRRNRARSWFWDKRSKDVETEINVEKTTLVPILQQNGNGGREFFVGGRRCPAHEDAKGFCKTLLEIILNE